MYALILNVVIAFAFVAYTANSEKWCSKRPSVNLKTIPCDRIEQSDLCRCCPVDPCDGVVCANGGQCVGEGVCNCTFGFGGPMCTMRVCNVTQCSDRGGRCSTSRCLTDGNDCGSKQCNATNDEVCIDDNCVVRSENCGNINENSFFCFPRGVQCGEGFCSVRGSRVCVNNACRFIGDCNVENDGTDCDIIGFNFTCSDGFCFAPCFEDSDCRGLPCIDGSCTEPKCGEPVCFQ